MSTYPTKLQLAYLKNLYYWTHGSKVLEEPFTFTWKHKIASFSPMVKGYPIATYWTNIHEDFAALVFGGYMIETENDGIKYYQLTETGVETGRWKSSLIQNRAIKPANSADALRFSPPVRSPLSN